MAVLDFYVSEDTFYTNAKISSWYIKSITCISYGIEVRCWW